MARERSENKKQTASATGVGSYGSQGERGRSAQACRSWSKSGIPDAARVDSGPAATRFARTAFAPRSRARYWFNERSAALHGPIQL